MLRTTSGYCQRLRRLVGIFAVTFSFEDSSVFGDWRSPRVSAFHHTVVFAIAAPDRYASLRATPSRIRFGCHRLKTLFVSPSIGITAVLSSSPLNTGTPYAASATARSGNRSGLAEGRFTISENASAGAFLLAMPYSSAQSPTMLMATILPPLQRKRTISLAAGVASSSATGGSLTSPACFCHDTCTRAMEPRTIYWLSRATDKYRPLFGACLRDAAIFSSRRARSAATWHYRPRKRATAVTLCRAITRLLPFAPSWLRAGIISFGAFLLQDISRDAAENFFAFPPYAGGIRASAPLALLHRRPLPGRLPSSPPAHKRLVSAAAASTLPSTVNMPSIALVHDFCDARPTSRVSHRELNVLTGKLTGDVGLLAATRHCWWPRCGVNSANEITTVDLRDAISSALLHARLLT